MRNKILQTHCHCLTFPVIFVVISGLPQTVYANDPDSHPTVVLLSMAQQNENAGWPPGEERITDELQLSNLNVISTPINAPIQNHNQDACNSLKAAAAAQNAAGAFLLYRTSDQRAKLCLYVNKTALRSESSKEYEISVSTNGDEADIIAFKAAEFFRAMLDNSRSATGAPWIQMSSPESIDGTLPVPIHGTPLSRRKKSALVFAISGVASLALGSVFHWRRNIHEDAANVAYDKMTAFYNTGSYRNATTQKDLFLDESSNAKMFNAGAITGYVLGGALLSASVGILLFGKESLSPEDSSQVSLRGTNITWSF